MIFIFAYFNNKVSLLQARRRLLLTGTPLQNNLIELMSLLVFLMPDLFVDKTDILKRIFTAFSVRKYFWWHVLLNLNLIFSHYYHSFACGFVYSNLHYISHVFLFVEN